MLDKKIVRFSYLKNYELKEVQKTAIKTTIIFHKFLKLTNFSLNLIKTSLLPTIEKLFDLFLSPDRNCNNRRVNSLVIVGGKRHETIEHPKNSI